MPYCTTQVRCRARQPHRVVLIPGDGIGPEVAEATARAVEATGISLEWERVELNSKTIEKCGGLVPRAVLDAMGDIRVGLKGPVSTPVGRGFQSVNLALRKKLNLFANFRPVRSLPGLKTRYTDVSIDLAIFRENTESLYSGLEHEVMPGIVESIKVITRKASLRIAKSAFAFARREGRKRITAVHKANILKLSDGLFLRCCREVAQSYPKIRYDEMIVDNAAMQLVMRPETFDVLLTPNLYGDILSDLAAGLVGGLGILPGANLGENCAIFEAVHGSAPDIAGKGVANPTALMRSAVLLLNHIGENAAAERLNKAIHDVYADGKSLTRDVGGSASTSQFTDAVIRSLESSSET